MRKFMQHFFRRLSATAAAAVLLAMGAVGYYSQVIPDSFYVEEGTEFVLNTHKLIRETGILTYGRSNSVNRALNSTSTVELKLCGLIPIKSAHISSIDRPVVVPGGTPFGIKLFTDGVIVIDLSDIETDQGLLCPAREAGIMKGDVIHTIAGNEVHSNEQIAAIITASNGAALPVELERNGKQLSLYLTPQRACADGKYKSGIWVRDSSAGIGTVTYYIPKTGSFAGLGHGICDTDTGQLMPLQEGEVCPVAINSIQKGAAGSPGELKGAFTSSRPCGRLYLNNEAGVFGTLDEPPNLLPSIPIKLKQEVSTGSATILCTLDDGVLREYAINIEMIDLNPNTMTKNMMITVTDPQLLARTGGIVQGMSGSPILQDGQLVGAVTHVFVNNPTKGYGIFAENMLEYNPLYSADSIA